VASELFGRWRLAKEVLGPKSFCEIHLSLCSFNGKQLEYLNKLNPNTRKCSQKRDSCYHRNVKLSQSGNTLNPSSQAASRKGAEASLMEKGMGTARQSCQLIEINCGNISNLIIEVIEVIINNQSVIARENKPTNFSFFYKIINL
jgi:hypothetical protein